MARKNDFDKEEEEEIYPEPTQEDLAQMDRIYAKRKEMWFTVTVYSLGGIVLFGGLGWLLDHWLGTKPLLLVALVLISFPFVQYALYKRIQKMIKK